MVFKLETALTHIKFCGSYMTDPVEGWEESDGGALELYPTVSPGTPAVRPSNSLLPVWNTMAMFVVEPGVSFHSVQEVFSRSKTRCSLQGYRGAAGDFLSFVAWRRLDVVRVVGPCYFRHRAD